LRAFLIVIFILFFWLPVGLGLLLFVLIPLIELFGVEPLPGESILSDSYWWVATVVHLHLLLAWILITVIVVREWRRVLSCIQTRKAI